MHKLLCFLAATALFLGTGASAVAQDPSGAREGLPPRVQGWSKTAIETAGSLPIQDGGRVKPLSTFAKFTLLRLNGRSTAKDNEGNPLSAMEWLLDVMVDPARANQYPVFQVQDSAAVHSLGLSVANKKRRDRWSFDELRPGMPKLFEFAHDYSSIDAKVRTSVQQQVIQLAEAVDIYLGLAGFLDFARAELRPLTKGGMLADEFGTESLTFTDVVRRAGDLGDISERLQNSTDPLAREASAELGHMLRAVSELGRSSLHMAMQPPDAELNIREAWHTPGEMLMTAFNGAVLTRLEMDSLVALEQLGDSLQDDGRIDMDQADAALAAVAGATKPLAAARGETRRLDLEVTYYKLDLLTYSLVAFVLAFLVTAFSWLRPGKTALARVSFGLVTTGTLLLCAAIAIRCVIRERPPVSTLYETLLFVTATGALIGLFAEWANKKRIALAATAVLGMVGLFLANGYETLDKKDTMPSLVAVLDTNFWLATHVTTITIGYAAGMFAALLASVYLIARSFRRRAQNPELFGALARMTYGTLCFGLVFSLVGTILGGIWANDSWGRFWGWDPKENGALLICISQVAILHARMGGYLKEIGIAVASAFGGTIVAFSWFGTNLLGVGLHSYGFTSGISQALWTYYGIQWGICLLGAVALVRESRPAPAPEARSKSAFEPRTTT